MHGVTVPSEGVLGRTATGKRQRLETRPDKLSSPMHRVTVPTEGVLKHAERCARTKSTKKSSFVCEQGGWGRCWPTHSPKFLPYKKLQKYFIPKFENQSPGFFISGQGRGCGAPHVGKGAHQPRTLTWRWIIGPNTTASSTRAAPRALINIKGVVLKMQRFLIY